MSVPLYRWLVDCDGKVADEVRYDEASDRVRGLIRDHHRLEAQHVACAPQRVFSARVESAHVAWNRSMRDGLAHPLHTRVVHKAVEVLRRAHRAPGAQVQAILRHPPQQDTAFCQSNRMCAQHAWTVFLLPSHGMYGRFDPHLEGVLRRADGVERVRLHRMLRHLQNISTRPLYR